MTVVDELPAPAPPPGDAAPGRLDPRVVTVWRLGGAVAALVAAAHAAVAALVLDASPLWALAVLAPGLAAALFVPAALYRAWSWRVSEGEVRLKRGLWWRAESVVPLSRIQHVDTRQGPLQRAFGLATVVVFTAGSVGARVAIPGLDAAQAEALRDRLALLGGREDAV
jgi:uncharacterized protein